jgi:hypothetical protein
MPGAGLPLAECVSLVVAAGRTGKMLRPGAYPENGSQPYQNRRIGWPNGGHVWHFPRQAEGRDLCHWDLHRGCFGPAFRRALGAHRTMTAKRPREPNELAKSIIDIVTGEKPGRDPTRRGSRYDFWI